MKTSKWQERQAKQGEIKDVKKKIHARAREVTLNGPILV